MAVQGSMLANIPIKAAAVTANDTVNLDAISTLYVGTGGNVVIVTENDDTVTLVNVPSGTFIPIGVKKVKATSTTASDIVALW